MTFFALRQTLNIFLSFNSFLNKLKSLGFFIIFFQSDQIPIKVLFRTLFSKPITVVWTSGSSGILYYFLDFLLTDLLICSSRYLILLSFSIDSSFNLFK